MKKFRGEKVRELRRQRGLTVRDLAKRLKVSPTYISKIENNKANPSVPTLEALASALGVEPGYFFEHEKPSLAQPEKEEAMKNDAVSRKEEGGSNAPGDPVEDLLRRFENRDPDTMTVEEALEIILRAEHVMFSGVPPGREMDEDVLLDVREALVHLVKFLLKQKRMGTKILTAGGKSGGPTAPGN